MKPQSTNLSSSKDTDLPGAHHHILGCDVGKDSIVIFVNATGKTIEVPNQVAAIEAFLDEVPEQSTLICEATGGYEMQLLNSAFAQGLAAVRVDPRKAHAFLKSLRSFGKTDGIDAEGLARYGIERFDQLSLFEPNSKIINDMRALIRLRDELCQYKSDYKRRFKAPLVGAAASHIKGLIEDLEQRIAAIDDQIQKLVGECPHIKQKVELIQSIKGCGPVVAPALVALLPELGTISRKQIASLAGLAPHPFQSGKHEGRRSVRGGRPEVKRLLFLAALSAQQYNAELKPFYDRLIENGKKPIVATVAVARKLITIINAMIKIQLNQQLS